MATLVNGQSTWHVELIVFITFTPKMAKKLSLWNKTTNSMIPFFTHVDCASSCIHYQTLWIHKATFTISMTAKLSDELSFQSELLDSVVEVVGNVNPTLAVSSDIIWQVKLSRL